MPVQAQYREYILEQLAALGALRANRMFGGVGLYSNELFFGLIDDDTLFFKTDESNVAEYRARGMPRFMPFPDRPEAALGYHQVPADIIEDSELLVAWARLSLAVALAARVAKKPTAKTRPVKGTRAARKTVARPARTRPGRSRR